MEQPTPERREYEIDGLKFSQEPLSFMQETWLAQYVFEGLNVEDLDGLTVMRLLQQHGPLWLAICLIPDGQTRTAKGQAGIAAVRELERWLACALTPTLLQELSRDFFALNPFENLWLLANYAPNGTSTSDSAALTGSSPASVSSPEAISPSAITS